ncbi:cobalamin biosynthesis protein [Candidatus Aerophobetes bacterium]|nr:cobalamin biosynthesis protein [Candidatus Aerophobetes bacterium]
MRIAIIAINKEGKKTAQILNQNFMDSKIYTLTNKVSLKSLVGEIFNKFDGIIFIMALGIVVRVIAPYLKDKYHDPAVVVVDKAKRFAISTLSGHEGGANKLTFIVARILDAMPIITTASDTEKKIIVGIGCRRGISEDAIKKAILSSLKEKGISLKEVRLAATIDIKRNEKGLVDACSGLNLPLVFIDRERIKNFCGQIETSEVVERNLGLKGVCEPCALLAGRKAKLILKRKFTPGVAVAIAREDYI